MNWLGVTIKFYGNSIRIEKGEIYSAKMIKMWDFSCLERKKEKNCQYNNVKCALHLRTFQIWTLQIQSLRERLTFFGMPETPPNENIVDYWDPSSNPAGPRPNKI